MLEMKIAHAPEVENEKKMMLWMKMGMKLGMKKKWK